MAKRRLSMRKIREVLRLYGAGMSVRAIARSVKASPSTVGEYIRRAQVHGRLAVAGVARRWGA